MVNVPPNPPVARRLDPPASFEMFGVKVEDEYAWLRNKDWPEYATEEEILNHLDAENAYFEKFVTEGERPELRKALFEELKGKIQLVDKSTYRQRDDYFYYSRLEADAEYPVYCRKKGSTDAPEEVTLDQRVVAEGESFCKISLLYYSPDHTKLAYDADFSGDEFYTIYVKDLVTGKLLKGDTIPNVVEGLVWHPDSKGFFYTPANKYWRAQKLYFHKLGDDMANDKLVFETGSNQLTAFVASSCSEEFVFVVSANSGSKELYFIDLADPTLTPKLLHKRMDAVKPQVDHIDGYFYKLTNEDGAKNFKLLRAKSEGFDIEKTVWETYRAEDPKKWLSSFDLSADYIVMTYNNVGLNEFVVRHVAAGTENTVKFPEVTYDANASVSYGKTNDIRISYSAPATPPVVYRYHPDTDKLEVLKVQEIPSGHNPDDYVVERIFAQTDGVEVPISILYKKGVDVKGGTSPCYLTGYGSYGYARPANWASKAIALADRGFVFAIAHIRGGSDLGYDWYQQAKFLTKKRTFTDFIAAAERLIEVGMTYKGGIVTSGGSAGGMLVATCMLMRPELYKGVVALVPFMDVLQVMLDETVPLTPDEFHEWGNPKNEEYFHYMRSYSPYDNIKPADYPHLYVSTGLSDPRVGFWEGAKFTCRLRDLKTNNSLVLHRNNSDCGHRGASGRFDYLDEVALELIFVLAVFGKDTVAKPTLPSA